VAFRTCFRKFVNFHNISNPFGRVSPFEGCSLICSFSQDPPLGLSQWSFLGRFDDPCFGSKCWGLIHSCQNFLDFRDFCFRLNFDFFEIYIVFEEETMETSYNFQQFELFNWTNSNGDCLFYRHRGCFARSSYCSCDTTR
jgi:hypothetical protein